MVRSFIFTAASPATAPFISTSHAVPVHRRDYEQTAALISDTEYCVFLPPQRGSNIADNEDRTIVFCNVLIETALNAGIISHGLIQSVHFVENTEDGWIQITGRLDPSAYDLSSDDQG
ncbi:hypothetical protein BGZ80_002245 [Entomortierella chlamydospora]|uniref:Uncharacterized protein n=1 Tax=Entomortierella chlamydospora TaxID=101097 RepID=A0A9P6T376_9FUNG|nr:hypothetical protein BGZ80_002245 [Entomortierella chlamydospora]